MSNDKLNMFDHVVVGNIIQATSSSVGDVVQLLLNIDGSEKYALIKNAAAQGLVESPELLQTFNSAQYIADTYTDEQINEYLSSLESNVVAMAADKVTDAPRPEHQMLAEAQELGSKLNDIALTMDSNSRELISSVMAANEAIDDNMQSMLYSYGRLLEQRTNGMVELVEQAANAKELVLSLSEAREATTIGSTAEFRALEALIASANPMHAAKVVKQLKAYDKTAAQAIISMVKRTNRVEDFRKHLLNNDTITKDDL